MDNIYSFYIAHQNYKRSVTLCVCVCVVLRGFGRPRIIEYSAISKSYTFLCIVQVHAVLETVLLYHILYRSADKFLARPGRKQATATEGFVFRISYL